MRRSSLVILVAVSLSVLASSRASALEAPLATLVPPDVSTYSELDLDRMLWKAPETAPLAEAFGQMQSPRMLSNMLVQLADAEDLEELTQVFDVLSQASKAVGPRIGWATWVPDVQSLLGGMTEPSDLGAALSMIPKVLIVADVRDRDIFDGLLDAITQELGVPALTTEGVGGTRVTTFAEGIVALVRGEDWLALSFPPDPARIAADQWRSGDANSLWSSPAYQAVMRRLPADAILTEYVSAKSVKQLVGIANVLAPEAQLSYPSDEPLGSAMGLRVEHVQGRKMATAYYTADLDTLPYAVDAALALQLAFIRSELAKEREADAAAKCAANLELLGTAMEAYLDEHNDRFPTADGWVEDLLPYVEDERILECPADDTGAVCSYAMNAALSGKSLAELDDPASILVLYETASPGDSPSGGAADVVSPARHPEGNHYLFADGHVELLEEAPSFEAE